MTDDLGKNKQQNTRGQKGPGDTKGKGNTTKSQFSSKLKKFYKKYLGQQGEDGHYTLIHDVVIALIVVIIIISAIYAYTRTWPPTVVVESGSMQHSTDRSSLGVIDTGDIVLRKKVDSVDDITTWAEGEKKGYKTYGEYGDVIIYDKNGKGGTPVIHRAIVYIRHNETIGGKHYFDVPEWGIYHNQTIEYSISELRLEGANKIKYTPPRGHDGFLTKGDNKATNRKIDQQSGIKDVDGGIVRQVSIGWVKGVARGEVPWFGLINLKIKNNENLGDAPENSWKNLKISLFLIIGVPIILNVMYYAFAKKYGTLDEDEETQEARKGKGGKQLSKRHERVQIGRKGGR
ncbi:MAG: S26 family signal peptidase [Thermoplasmata archaeon]|nr:S26 family signal peptidase [Thermoplasmata archaeon]